MKEVNRQYVHIATAILIILFLLEFGKTKTTILLFVGLILGSIIMNLKSQKKKLPVIDLIIEKFERNKTRFVGYGSAWFIIGCLVSVLFLTDINQIIAIVWILGIGDGLSTLIGIRGKIKLPYNKNKTFEGSIALFLSSLPTYLLIGPIALPLAILSAIVESLPLPLDDNATIPLVGIAILRMWM